jgi:hypothetical protein
MSSGVIQPPRQPRRPALDPIGTPEGPLPLRAQTPVELSPAPITPIAPRLETLPRFSASDPRSYEAKGGSTKLVIERRISEQPTDIRDAARTLSKELKSQVNELKQLRWNDPDRITQRDNLVALLESMATGLANLANNLDQAISKGTKGKPEPVFLGKAAEVTQQLHFRLMQWLEVNRTAVFEVPFRVGIFVTGVALLHSLGADSATAIAALGVLVKSTARKKNKEKRQRK